MAGAQLLAQGIDRRRAILRFVKAHVRKNGYAPTVAEVTDELGFASKNAARHHLGILAREGFIQLTPGVHRGMRVVSDRRYP